MGGMRLRSMLFLAALFLIVTSLWLAAPPDLEAVSGARAAAAQWTFSGYVYALKRNYEPLCLLP